MLLCTAYIVLIIEIAMVIIKCYISCFSEKPENLRNIKFSHITRIDIHNIFYIQKKTSEEIYFVSKIKQKFI